MKDLLALLLHLLITIAKLLGPGGAKAVVADSTAAPGHQPLAAACAQPISTRSMPVWLLVIVSRSTRLIGTIRREFLDHVVFWNANDLERKLEGFRQYYNAHRVHTSLDGNTPSETTRRRADLNQFQWKSHCRGLYHLPVAA